MQTEDGRDIDVGQRWRRPDGEHIEVIGIEPPTVHVNVLHQAGAGIVSAGTNIAADFRAYTLIHPFRVAVRGTPEYQIRTALGRTLAGYRTAVPRENTFAPEYQADVWAANEAETSSLVVNAIAGTEADVIAVATRD